MSDAQRTLVLIKPDAVSRGLAGRVLSRYEDKGLAVVAMRMLVADADLSRRHYADHVEKAFYPGLEAFITSGPLVALVLEGPRAIEIVRTMNGATDSAAAAPGTIRGDWSVSNQENLVHASDSVDSAAREIAIWFPGS